LYFSPTEKGWDFSKFQNVLGKHHHHEDTCSGFSLVEGEANLVKRSGNVSLLTAADSVNLSKTSLLLDVSVLTGWDASGPLPAFNSPSLVSEPAKRSCLYRDKNPTTGSVKVWHVCG
jgi:hypothetical protein